MGEIGGTAKENAAKLIGSGESKEKAFAAAGVPVAKIPSEMIDLIKAAIKEKVAA